VTRFCPQRTTVVHQQVSPERATAFGRWIVPAAALLLGTLLGSVTAVAQPAAGTEPNWDVIRKGPLSVTDQATVPKWIAGQIDQVFAAGEPAKVGLEFFKKIATQMRAADADARFKEAIGLAITQEFVKRYQQASGGENKPNPLASVFVLMALRQTGPTPAALPAFQAVLGDAAPAARCQGIMGINALRAALPAAARTGLVAPVSKAALTETSEVVLTRYYDFLRFVGDNPAQGQDLQIATGLIAILDARLARVEKQDAWPVVGDAEVVNWLAGKAKAPAFGAAQPQKEIVRVAARLLVDAGYAAANAKPSEQVKADLERIAALIEDPADGEKPVYGLKDLFTAKVANGAMPAPSITELIASTAPDQKAKVNAAIAKLIGVDQTKGVLNDPFGLPIGLSIQRPAPATSTAPAS
jgi:hypothetical protein